MISPKSSFSETKRWEKFTTNTWLSGISLFRFNRHRQHLYIFHFHLQTGKFLVWFQIQRRSSWSDSWKWNFDTSHEFWENCSARNKSLKKKLGYFSIKNIDDPCIMTVAVNSKEYFETFKSENVNKTHRGLRKSAVGMEFEKYSKRINSIKEIETFGQLPKEKQKQNRSTNKNNEMILEETGKSKFA